MNRRMKTLAAIILIGLITAAATLCVLRLSGRARLADLTEDRLYSLSEGTHNILRKLNQPLTLKLYYSRQAALEGPDGIRFWNNYFLYVRDLLQEYASLSGGKIRLEVIDPQSYSIEEEEAVGYGLRRFDLGSNSFIFGLAAVTELGRESALPFFEPQRQAFVEYDVSKLISDLTQRQKLSVGVISSLPVLGDDYPPYMLMMLQQQGQRVRQPWAVMHLLKESYEVFEARVREGRFEREPDYLLVIHPKELDRQTLFAIDQYVVGGGKAAVFVDPLCLSDQPENPQQQQSHSSASDLNALLERWGLRMDAAAVVADPGICVRVPLQQGMPAEPFPPFLQFQRDNISKTQALVSGMSNLQMIMAGDLRGTHIDGMEVTPLLFTTPEANLWRPTPAELMRPPRFAQMLQGFKPADAGVKNCAVLLRGRFKTNFPDGLLIEESPADNGAGFTGEEAPGTSDEAAEGVKEPEGAASGERRVSALAQAAEEGLLLVVADVDMLADAFAFRQNTLAGMSQSGDNAAFLFNALDYLGGSLDLLQVRTRGEYLRPFTVIDEIERKAEEQTAGKVEELNQRIQAIQQELGELVSSQGGKNTEILQKGILEKKRELEAEIVRVNRQLRQLQQDKRQAVRQLQSRLELFNLLAAPAAVLLVGLVIWIRRLRQRRRILSVRAAE